MLWDTVTPDEPMYVWVTDAELRTILQRNGWEVLSELPTQAWLTTPELTEILMRNLTKLETSRNPNAAPREHMEDEMWISRRRGALARLQESPNQEHAMLLAAARVPGAYVRGQRYITLAPVPTHDTSTHH